MRRVVDATNRGIGGSRLYVNVGYGAQAKFRQLYAEAGHPEWMADKEIFGPEHERLFVKAAPWVVPMVAVSLLAPPVAGAAYAAYPTATVVVGSGLLVTGASVSAGSRYFDGQTGRQIAVGTFSDLSGWSAVHGGSTNRDFATDKFLGLSPEQRGNLFGVGMVQLVPLSVGGVESGMSLWANRGGIAGGMRSMLRLGPLAEAEEVAAAGTASQAGVQANKLAGDSVADAIAIREAGIREGVFQTVGGERREDVVVLVVDDILGIESKVGPTYLTPRVRQELARDWWLLRQGKLDRIRWEFTPNAAGKVGPSAPLRLKIEKLGFEVKINIEVITE